MRQRLHRLLQTLVQLLLRCALRICIVVLYLVGFTLTRLLMPLLDRASTTPSCDQGGSSWTTASGYEATVESWAHPS